MQEGNADDWKEIYEAVKKTPPDDFRRISIPTITYGAFHLYADQESLLPEIKTHVPPGFSN